MTSFALNFKGTSPLFTAEAKPNTGSTYESYILESDQLLKTNIIHSKLVLINECKFEIHHQAD